MAVPKRRKTSSKRNMRRAQHDKIIAPNVVACPECAAPMVSHRVCPGCGHYKGRNVLGSEAQAESDEAEG